MSLRVRAHVTQQIAGFLESPGAEVADVQEGAAPLLPSCSHQVLPQLSARKPRIKALLRIRDILVRIRIRGSTPLTNGSGCGSCYFSLVTLKTSAKNLKIIFFAYYFLRVHLHNFFKIKGKKEIHNSRNVFLTTFA